MAVEGFMRSLDEWRCRLRGCLHRKFRHDIACIANFIPQHGTLVDIGANHGRYSLELSRLRPQCTILALEPMPWNIEIASFVLSMRRNVLLREIGVSCDAGTAELLVRRDARGRYEHGSASIADGGSCGDEKLHDRFTITTRPLDDILDDERLHDVVFLKIDVEGHEWAVVRGAERVLQQHKPSMLVELRSERIAPGADSRPVLELLASHGYRFRDLDLRDEGMWTTDCEGVAATLDTAHKAHDVLAWHPVGPVPGEPPEFRVNFALTRYGT